MFIQGKARRVGDNVNTDQMYPTRYTSIVEDSEMAKHCMEDYDPDLIKRMDPGDVLVAGVGFGCGSSREHAPKSVKAAGFSCVVAKGFSRIFYRNAVLPESMHRSRSKHPASAALLRRHLHVSFIAMRSISVFQS